MAAHGRMSSGTATFRSATTRSGVLAGALRKVLISTRYWNSGVGD